MRQRDTDRNSPQSAASDASRGGHPRPRFTRWEQKQLLCEERRGGRLTAGPRATAMRDVRPAIARSSGPEERRRPRPSPVFWGGSRPRSTRSRDRRWTAYGLGTYSGLHSVEGKWFHLPNRLSVHLCTGHRARERVAFCSASPTQRSDESLRPVGRRVHSDTARFSRGAYSFGMQLLSLKAVVASVWISAICLAGIAGNLNSLSSWLVLAAVAVLPPMVMIRQWSDPAQTMSESIQEARR